MRRKASDELFALKVIDKRNVTQPEYVLSEAEAMQQEQSDLTKAILQSKVYTSKQGAHLPHNALCT